jgi:lipopolysaccharide export LptBFGC system permease protein LptF
VPTRMNRCPYCREEVREVHLSVRAGKDGRREVRRGLMYMLLGAVIYYFSGGYSAMSLPYPLNPIVTVYLSPAVFLGGLGMCLYGIYLRIRS